MFRTRKNTHDGSLLMAIQYSDFVIRNIPKDSPLFVICERISPQTFSPLSCVLL